MLTVKIQFQKSENESLEQAADRLDGHNGLELVELKEVGDGTFWARIKFKSKYDMCLTIAELFELVDVGETDIDKIAAGLAMSGEYFTEE